MELSGSFAVVVVRTKQLFRMKVLFARGEVQIIVVSHD